ncbi:hypothetical protein A2160_03130 [Candidatus Beckwithbacteria bacterium RBG_13_42_9]|uniref:Fido domain-containing protein n=1 Tax=Candidatus Beckwithbacteria bacterium RBG_13_42_9 TaxID=1797457 RepID=A0A1F5E7V6_9BACT|nr:MAG: hypothetical protein A2160_03130 [Candidatus Beckwithbacteria bacterium RBG_13_42_9]
MTSRIVSLLQEIERLRTRLALLPQHKIAEKFIRQKSLLKSAVCSARIEGNPRTIKEVTLSGIRYSKTKANIEINNLYQALEYILSIKWQQSVTMEEVKKIHRLVMASLSGEAGYLRAEASAIFNMAGVAVYLPPMPEEIKNLLKQLLDYLNQDLEPIIPVKAGVIHYCFEKLHPFLDGNGRVGRLLIHLVLKKFDYNFRGLVPIEEYFENHRQDYYDTLLISEKNITPFLEFFLEGLKVGLNKAVENNIQPEETHIEDDLPPRRLEILQIIRDHKQVSLDFVRRRFLRISPRLLRYDLKRLQDLNLIKKQGVTKGAVYEPKQEEIR